jgi:AcrR family transcriptional regulator
MRLTQRTALDLFEQRGFDNVTVAEVAAEVGMAASTIYRHFDTKEAIVLWDEHEVGLDKALTREFGRKRPLAAMGEAFAAELGGRYDTDLDFQLRRVSYIYRTPQLHAAAVEADFEDRQELAAALRSLLPKKQRDAAPLLAGAAMLALDVAFDRWQQNGGKEPLRQLIDEAFAHLANLDALG